MGDRAEAERLTEEAAALQDRGDAHGAERVYLGELAADP